MPKNRDASDPLATKRRLLEQQERLLAQRRRELKQQLESGSPEAAARLDEPPVWRMEDDHHDRGPEVAPARPRHLARQRQRDMVVFLCMGALLMAIVVLLWIAWVHAATPARSA